MVIALDLLNLLLHVLVLMVDPNPMAAMLFAAEVVRLLSGRRWKGN